MKIINEKEQIILKPETDIVASIEKDFRAALDHSVKNFSNNMIMDFSGVQTIDSVGIGLIIAFYNSLAIHKRNLKIINMAENIYDLFKIMRLNKVIAIEKK